MLKRRKNYTWIFVILVWCILIILAGQIDAAYHERRVRGWAACMAGQMVKWGHKKGITFKSLYDALNGYSSVLVTVVGMIVTGWINVSERLEQRVYGFRRKELLPAAKLVTSLFAGVFCTPVWMVYAIVHRYCFMAYCIMGMVFVQFLISNVLLAMTYSNNYDYNALIKKIRKSLEKVRSMKDFCKYEDILDRIAGSIDKNTNWKELYEIFLGILSELDNEEECLKVYKISYSFAHTVVAVKSKCLYELLVQYTQKMNRNNWADDKAKRVYWVLLDCMYQTCSERQINDYLEQLFSEMMLDRNIGIVECYYKIEDMEDIFSMVVLQTECWLQNYNGQQLEPFNEKLNKIFRLGSRQYIGKEKGLLSNLINERDAITNEYSSVYHQCYKRLEKSYSANRGQHMGSFVESIVGIYKKVRGCTYERYDM